MVPIFYENGNVQNSILWSKQKSFNVSLFQTSSSDESIAVNGSNIVRTAFLSKGLPSETVDIMMASCSDSTNKQYQSALRKWSEFCSENKLDVFTVSIENILLFLTSLYKKGLGYSSINTIRSALSLVLPNVEGSPIGSHPLIVRFLKAIGRLKPPTRRYNTVWDVGKVLDLFLKWPENNQLSLKQLTMKSCGLLAILSGQRVQTLSLISLSDIRINENTIEIYVKETIKTSRPGTVQPNIVLPAFPINDRLCPVKAVTEYIAKTKSLRGSVEQLWISYEKPHSFVKTQTISRWLKSVLFESGIDISIFKSHSFRHASTSKAFEAGVNVDVIFASAGWNERSKVFANFYKCKIDNRCNYAKSILSQSI